jgi:hypothetical protein
MIELLQVKISNEIAIVKESFDSNDDYHSEVNRHKNISPEE